MINAAISGTDNAKKYIECSHRAVIMTPARYGPSTARFPVTRRMPGIQDFDLSASHSSTSGGSNSIM